MDNLGLKSDLLACAITAAVCLAAGSALLFFAGSSASDRGQSAMSHHVQVTALIYEPEAQIAEPAPPGTAEKANEDKVLSEPPEPEPEPEIEPEEPAPAMPEPSEPVQEDEVQPTVVKQEEAKAKAKPEPQKLPQTAERKKPSPPRGNPHASKEGKKVAPSASLGAAQRGEAEVSGVTAPVSDPAQAAKTALEISHDRALAVLLGKVESLKNYPARARQQGVQGRCVIRFTISGAGVVTDSALGESSGSSLLDASCRRTGQKLIGTATGATTELIVNVPVNFKLTDS